MGPTGLRDEYPKGAEDFDDEDSIINVGRQLRARHLAYVRGSSEPDPRMLVHPACAVMPR